MSKSFASKLPLLLLFVLLAALVSYLLWPQTVVERKKHQRVVAVKTAQVKTDEFTDIIEAVGTSRAAEQVVITSKYADIVDSINFVDGQKVKKGDVLVSLNSQEEEAKVRELQANLSEAKAQFDRYEDLLTKKATSKSLVEQQEAQVKGIAAQLYSATTKVEHLTIKAPFDGILGFREISVGAYLGSGDAITTIDDISTIKVDFAIPERYLSLVAVGQIIKAKTTAYAKQFNGEIVSIGARIDPITRTIMVRANIPNPNDELRPGMLIKVTVKRQTDTVLQVPESAVIPIENKHFVFVVTEGKAAKVQVGIGRRQPGVVEIREGLTEGEQVVIEGALKLRDGSAVKVLENEQ